MADYHRFVAYIYEYVNGKKIQNAGFAKIELRNGICRIQIHIQNVRMLDGKTEVFGIVRQPKESRKNNPIILLIGEGQTQGSGFDRRFTVPEEPFVEESCRFEQVCGIYIRSQSGRNWMTVFDDEPIAIENLGKPEEAVAEIEEEMTETEEKTVKENEPEEENIKIKENKKSEKTFEQNEYEKIEEPEKTEAKDLQESQIEKAENEQKEASEIEKAEEPEKSEPSEENINSDISEYAKAEPEITAEEMQEEIFSKEVAEEIPEKVSMKDRSEKISEETFQKEVSEKISQELQDAVSQKERPKETDEEIPPKETVEESESESRIKSAETENKCQGCEPGTDTRWNRATARYIHFQPVQDEKIEDAIRIQPSDLKILWQKGLRQGSNSFLMHGYYQHQHLLIGKSKEGGYVLGIPGFYGEKNMAEMFGFPEFRRAKADQTSEIKEQTFGYWCKNLE